MSGSWFRTSRNIELSTIYYLETSIASDWSGITVVKTFKEVYASTIPLPIVCVRLAETSTTRLEIGSSTIENRYLIVLDVFAKSDAQRLDLADYIKDKIKDGWVHYDHSHQSGDNTQLDRSANGRDWITEWLSDGKVELGGADEKDKFRHSLSFLVRKSS